MAHYRQIRQSRLMNGKARKDYMPPIKRRFPLRQCFCQNPRHGRVSLALMKICHTCQQIYSDDVEFCPRDSAHLSQAVGLGCDGSPLWGSPTSSGTSTYRMGRAFLPSTRSTTSLMAAIRRLPVLDCLVFYTRSRQDARSRRIITSPESGRRAPAVDVSGLASCPPKGVRWALVWRVATVRGRPSPGWRFAPGQFPRQTRPRKK